MENQSDNTSVSRYYSKKRRKKRRKLMFYTLLTVFMVVVITVLSLTVFFNITEFEVEGNARYGTEGDNRGVGASDGAEYVPSEQV